MAKANRTCYIGECNNSVVARGLCNAHWQRWWKYGDPLKGGTPRGEAQRFYRDVVLPYRGDECLIWPYAKTFGYGVLRVNGKLRRVSRMVCEHFNGAPESDRLEAAHSCGKGSMGCVTPSHLRWATEVENMRDQYDHGTRVMGDRHGRSRLKESDVRDIRALEGKFSQSEIAKRFGVSREHVRDIHKRKRWGWLDP